MTQQLRPPSHIYFYFYTHPSVNRECHSTMIELLYVMRSVLLFYVKCSVKRLVTGAAVVKVQNKDLQYLSYCIQLCDIHIYLNSVVASMNHSYSRYPGSCCLLSVLRSLKYYNIFNTTEPNHKINEFIKYMNITVIFKTG